MQHGYLLPRQPKLAQRRPLLFKAGFPVLCYGGVFRLPFLVEACLYLVGTFPLALMSARSCLLNCLTSKVYALSVTSDTGAPYAAIQTAPSAWVFPAERSSLTAAVSQPVQVSTEGNSFSSSFRMKGTAWFRTDVPA